jgi:hypothetical protein
MATLHPEKPDVDLVTGHWVVGAPTRDARLAEESDQKPLSLGPGSIFGSLQ